ncbi:TPA: NAD(P)-binding protein [Neisseria bacilliformis]|uniref:Amine oxidase n=1 Tax=Neisseria bacilliformis ATCC BAA-1200 TaxID=888742 RepID=F2BDI5_9NEIS|nr:NAD(P)/FAD-dependent oxidoreductase [Neisseria bacilliformis]EGF10581.1 amine oxidase [Neisseria bacilliformis ATCC BAA-1200]QMT46589.1 twin-arginine translocation pathway signal [Neisseria bacilliformis]
MPTRRRFLLSAAALAAASAASWKLWRPQLPPVSVNRPGLPFGHTLRDGGFSLRPERTVRCGTLILGSGAAALTALWYLVRHGRRDILLAEGLERNGNNAGFYHGELAAPTGAHYLALPSPESAYVREMLADLGIMRNGAFNETDLVYAPQERLLYQGKWQDALLPRQDADSRRFFTLTGRLKTAYGRDGRKIFAIPIALSSHDEQWRRLDALTFAQWLRREGYRSPTLLWYLDYCCRDDYGRGIADVSAFAGLHYFCARGPHADTVLTWPDGLAHISEALRRRSGLRPLTEPPQENEWRFSTPASWDASAVKIQARGSRVAVWLRHNQSGRTILADAQNVICAIPPEVAAHIVENAAQYGLRPSETAPWLIANFVLNRFLQEPENSELAWDNVIYGSPHLGYVAAGNQLIRAAKPPRTVFTAYTAPVHDTTQNIRRLLLDADAETLLRPAAADLLHAYGSHFWRSVETVSLTVRGHGMAVPRPGYLTDPALLRLRQTRPPLLFAHSGMSGYSVFEEAAYWGAEAAKKIIEAV